MDLSTIFEWEAVFRSQMNKKRNALSIWNWTRQ